MTHQGDLVASGYWPLYRYDPRMAKVGKHPFRVDSRPPTIPFAEVAAKEARYAVLGRVNPEHAGELMAEAQQDIDTRWKLYQEFTEIDWVGGDDEEEA